MPLLYHAYVYLEFLILACTIYILAPRYTQQEIGELYGRCRSTAWHHIHSALQMLHEEMEVLSHE